MANFSVSALPLGTDSILAIYASGGAFLGSLNGIAQVVVLCGGSLQVTPVANSQTTINCSVVPGLICNLLRSTNLPGEWVTLLTKNAPAGGTFQRADNFSDLEAPPNTAYYWLEEP